MRVREWLVRNKTVASVTVLAVLLATPVTIAVLHEGFPLDDVDLTARDVWVTKGSDLLAGRLNMQIRELNGSVRTGRDIEVLQDGDAVFVHDAVDDSLQRVDASYTQLREAVELPAGSSVAYGGDRLSVVSAEGSAWVIDATQPLLFSAEADPLGELGAGSSSVVTQSGTVFAFSPASGSLVRLDPLGGEPTVVTGGLDVSAGYELTAVGERVVIFDVEARSLVFDDGRVFDAQSILRVQQPGPARAGVVVATSTDLLQIGFDGSTRVLASPGTNGPATDGSGVAAPVVVGACVHGAWATAATYAGVCDGADPIMSEISGLAPGARLEFRVNRTVVALNDIQNGRSWLALDELIDTTDNWDEVTPPADDETDQVDDTVVQQSLAETLAQRTADNHAPIALPDSLGARPGTTTILPVLDNDSDADGDVLTITSVTDIGSAGTLSLVEDGRAIQFAPGPGVVGTVSFRYTVSDGRTGGTAEAQTDVAIRPRSQNEPPQLVRTVSVDVGVGQSRVYNVLRDWRDPDGDELFVTGAQSTTGDTVHFRPQGEITFTNDGSGQPGPKPVLVTVSDGIAPSTPMEIVFDLTSGDLPPVPTPDYLSAFVGDRVEVSPLENDVSLSGEDLEFSLIEQLDGSNPVELDYDPEAGVVRLRGYEPGTYYFSYLLDEGDPSDDGDDVAGVIRFDVLVDPDDPTPALAVKDTGYLRPAESVVVPVLANDLSPSGEVLGIQSFVLPPGSPLTVEILGGTVLRVSSVDAFTEQAPFEYTISDGRSSSTAGVTIVPVPELTNHRAPIARGDSVTVRTGDIASVPVLDNDFHPDGTRMVLDPVLVEGSIPSGTAFVNGDRVRVKAPDQPGQFVLTYRVTDAFEEAATARLVVTVVDGDPENNKPPVAPTVEARVFEGGSVPIEIPLDGIDPDGDSVEFTGASGAAKGSVTAVGPTSFSYTALEGARGTDTFFYRVRDALGAVASGVVRVGVIPRATAFPPSAVMDEVTIGPGRTTELPVLVNDSDPNGFPIALDPELLEVDPALRPEVVDDLVVLTAPGEEGTYRFGYRISSGATDADGAPLTADAVVVVTVDENAPVQPPVAIDQVIDSDEVAGQRSTVVNVFDGAANPGGRTADLAVGLGDTSGDAPRAGSNGDVTVPIGDERRVFAYRLTNEVDDLSTWAFIVVPAYVDAPPPRLKEEYESTPPQLSMNSTTTWTLENLLEVPSGRPAIFVEDRIEVSPADAGTASVTGETGIEFQATEGYRGPAALIFTVTDGDKPDDPDGNQAVITLPIIVGSSTFDDVEPTFANTVVEVQPDETVSLDLRELSDHPNPDILARLDYSGLQVVSGSDAIDFELSGDQLVIRAARQDATGENAQVSLVVGFEGESGRREVVGTVDVTVISSKAPLPQAADDVEPEGRSSSPYSPDVLANDFNPFAADGDPLRIVAADFEGDRLGASLAWDAAGLTVTTGTAKSGTITVVYTIEDGIRDPNRRSSARFTVIVASAPEPVAPPALTNPSSQTVTAVFQPPVSSNGAEITGYTVRIEGGGGTVERTDCLPGTNCTFTGRINGQSQTVTVAATNRVGTTWSSASSITPYGTPSAPTNPDLQTNSSTATATITPTWQGPADDGGGSITYEWEYTSGASGNGSTTGTAGAARSVGEGDYAFRVRACNPGGCSAWVGDSVHVNAPPPSISLSRGAQTGVISGCSSGNCYYFRINAQGFTPNANFTAQCYSNDGSGEVSIGSTPYRAGSTTQLRFDGGGAFSGDIACWDGYGNVNRVVINGVSSNTSDF